MKGGKKKKLIESIVNNPPNYNNVCASDKTNSKDDNTFSQVYETNANHNAKVVRRTACALSSCKKMLKVNNISKGSATAVTSPKHLGSLLSDRVELVVYPQEVWPKHTTTPPSTPANQTSDSLSTTPDSPSNSLPDDPIPRNSQSDVSMTSQTPSIENLLPSTPPSDDPAAPAPTTTPPPPPPDPSSPVDPPEFMMSPASRKKVVFDLRRNKANKFSDYVKSLQAPPTPAAFSPTKSPSQSILKPPVVVGELMDDLDLVEPVPRGNKRNASRARRISVSPVKRATYAKQKPSLSYRSRSSSPATVKRRKHIK